MRGFVANTDYDWFTYLRAIEPPIDDVNFWKPGSEMSFRALDPGEPLFFKLKAPRNVIAGFGYFALFSKLPVSMAWQVYGGANGVASFGEMRERLLRIRQRFDMSTDPKQDFRIGCILLTQPVFFDEDEWIRIPDDFTGPIVQGRPTTSHPARASASGTSAWPGQRSGPNGSALMQMLTKSLGTVTSSPTCRFAPVTASRR